ncbi:MAG: periplasmic heavy metal sensor [Rhodobacteraceae bacterium]|nr:periplasmic heavy metal sensor [Paracoccaceae bacterium]
MTDTQPTPVTRTPLWIRVTLVVSLALNLLVVGIVMGSVATRDRDRGAPGAQIGAARDLGPLPFVMALEPQDRRALGRALRSEASSLRQNREELRVRFEALLAAIRADTFDAETVRGLLAEQRDIGIERQLIGERILLDRLGEMNVDERRAYAERLDKSLRRVTNR